MQSLHVEIQNMFEVPARITYPYPNSLDAFARRSGKVPRACHKHSSLGGVMFTCFGVVENAPRSHKHVFVWG